MEDPGPPPGAAHSLPVPVSHVESVNTSAAATMPPAAPLGGGKCDLPLRPRAHALPESGFSAGTRTPLQHFATVLSAEESHHEGDFDRAVERRARA